MFWSHSLKWQLIIGRYGPESPTPRQQVSPYLKMEFLVVKVRNSQEGVKKRSFRLIRIVFKITSSNFGTYTITLVKII